ncbi:MAG: hypothetical protein K0R92_405 [Lachnospiraceae bacterium]|jgi:hypothetical protein|nr:hypothetical protein [Lachnospiraceae bacterium]
MTPNQLRLSYKAYSQRKELEAEEYNLKFKNEVTMAKMQSWLTSNLVWAKKMPKLDDLLREKQQEMTDEQMLEKVKVLNDLFGGEVIESGKE